MFPKISKALIQYLFIHLKPYTHTKLIYVNTDAQAHTHTHTQTYTYINFTEDKISLGKKNISLPKREDIFVTNSVSSQIFSCLSNIMIYLRKKKFAGYGHSSVLGHMLSLCQALDSTSTTKDK